MSDFRRRLQRLEMMWPTPPCPTCKGRPHRVTWIDSDTDEVISDNMDGTGCPACGASVFRHYLLVIDREVHIGKAGCIANG